MSKYRCDFMDTFELSTLNNYLVWPSLFIIGPHECVAFTGPQFVTRECFMTLVATKSEQWE